VTAPPFNPRARLLEIVRYFTRLGFTAFGGPAVHISMMEEELVERRSWISRPKFLDLIALINCFPGPNSTQLAIALGRHRAGWRGLLLAGFCFISPAVLIILPIAWLYVTYHQLPHVSGALKGIGAAVVAIVLAALARFARSAARTPFTISVALAALALEFLVHRIHLPAGDLAILLLAGVTGAARSAKLRSPKLRALAPSALLPLAAAVLLAIPGPLIMILLFLQIGATLFGSGYVLISYLQTAFVDHRHWLTQRQLLDSIAVGQITPGPLLTTATFVGFILGRDQFHLGLPGSIACALAATAAIFAPSFVLMSILGPWAQKIRASNPGARALDAMSAAVTGLIAYSALLLSQQALQPPSTRPCAAILLATLALLISLPKFNSTWIILIAAAAGWLFM
jgi:chromate transporter